VTPQSRLVDSTFPRSAPAVIVNGMQSLAGHFLIASPRLADPNFVKSVVLMVQHGEEGALGLVVNRPLDTSVEEICEKVLETPCSTEGVLYQGGPCEGPLMVVHTHNARSDIEVRPGVHFSTERESIEWLLKYNEAPIKFFVGYSGWAAGQLENEMETGSWLSVPAEEDQIFQDGEELWSKLLTAATLGKWIDPERIPDDPSLN
jgi:putative transcriptional regulator